jgi:hypothetical protein
MYIVYITDKVFFVHATKVYRKRRYFSTYFENLYYMNDSDQVDPPVTLNTLGNISRYTYYRRLVGSESSYEGYGDEKLLVSVENQTTIPHACLPQLTHYMTEIFWLSVTKYSRNI